MITLVVARTDEALDWLQALPDHCKVDICNAGPTLRSADVPPGTEVLTMQADVGCAGSHIHYLRQLQQRLAAGDRGHMDPRGWTVFTASDALERAPALLELLAQPQNWGDVQALGLRGIARSVGRDDRREWVGGQPVRVERFCLHTLAPIGHVDPEAADLAHRYRVLHALPAGQNLLAHFLNLAGCHELAASATRADLGLSAPGGVFAVRNDRLVALLQDGGDALDRLVPLLHGDPAHRQMLERCWLHLFGLPFVTFTPLPRPVPALASAPTHAGLDRVMASIDAMLAKSANMPLLHPSEGAYIHQRRRVPTRQAADTAGGLCLSAIAALDTPSGFDATLAPAWIPELDRLGQIGARLHEQALS